MALSFLPYVMWSWAFISIKKKLKKNKNTDNHVYIVLIQNCNKTYNVIIQKVILFQTWQNKHKCLSVF